MAYQQERLECLRSALESAKETIKACLLINSGTAVALLAFMGHLITEKQLQLFAELTPSLWWFISGVIAAILAHASAYSSNWRFAYTRGAFSIQ
jgi:hypothetical protein